jgi:serine/threonine protein kinase
LDEINKALQDNVLVSQDGVAKLTDFGLTIMHEEDLHFSTTDVTGGGTLRWMVRASSLFSLNLPSTFKLPVTRAYGSRLTT